MERKKQLKYLKGHYLISISSIINVLVDIKENDEETKIYLRDHDDDYVSMWYIRKEWLLLYIPYCTPEYADWYHRLPIDLWLRQLNVSYLYEKQIQIFKYWVKRQAIKDGIEYQGISHIEPQPYLS